jgi:hypothetical protein
MSDGGTDTEPMIGEEFPFLYDSEWPKDCPPADAESGPFQCFRAVKAFPDPNEFRSSYESNLFKNVCPCRRRGLSILSSLEAAEHHQELFKDRKVIVTANLLPEHGVVKATPTRDQPNHYTWWPPNGLNRLAPFSKHEE